jgi:hypothetical protein
VGETKKRHTVHKHRGVLIEMPDNYVAKRGRQVINIMQYNIDIYGSDSKVCGRNGLQRGRTREGLFQ